MSFEPKILGFLCNWCSYAGADLAGVSRVQYPPNVRVVRVMCSGRVDPEFVLEGLISGLDGVIVLGCHPGDCHYLEGNYEEEKKFRALEKMLAKEGFDKRVMLDWVSASEGVRFGQVISNFVNQIKEQGPTPVKSDEVMKNKLKAMQMAMAGNKVRALVGRQRKVTEQENVYGEKVPKEKFDTILDTAMNDEYIRSQILMSITKEAKTVKDLAAELNADPADILQHVVQLKLRNQVAFKDFAGLSPLFIRSEV